MKLKTVFFVLFIFLVLINNSLAQSFNSDFSKALSIIDNVEYMDDNIAENYDVEVLCPKNIRIGTDKDSKSVSNVNLGSVSCTSKYIISEVSNDAPMKYNIGNSIVTWQLKTINGKVLSCNQSVRVKDTVLPIVLCPINVRVILNQEQTTANEVALGKIKCSDNFGIESIVNDAPLSYPVGNTIVTWTVQDINGNTSTCSQAVRVKK